jgi:hypothetical protein
MDRVERDFHSTGKPLHVADPSRSMFHIISLQDFYKMSHEDVQKLHAHKHLLVTGCTQSRVAFNAKGMNLLTDPERVFTIQGISPYSSRSPPLIYIEKIALSLSMMTKMSGAKSVKPKTS